MTQLASTNIQPEKKKMKTPLKTAAVGFGLMVLLSACIESDGVGTATPQTTSAPNAAEQACLQAIRAETSNPDVRLIGSSFSEAGTLVRAAVGPQNGVWQCIAYSDGSTAGVQFTGNEGTL